METVKKHLEPIHDTLKSIPLEAWNASKHIITRYKRTRADLVFDRMISIAMDKFAETDGIKIEERYETALFVYKEKVLFRFKKGDEEGLSRNARTQLSIAYNNPQQTLQGFEDLIRVDVVYVLDEGAVNIDRVMVVKRAGDEILWGYDLLKDGGATELPVKRAAVIVPSVSPKAENVEGRVKVKKRNNEKRG